MLLPIIQTARVCGAGGAGDLQAAPAHACEQQQQQQQAALAHSSHVPPHEGAAVAVGAPPKPAGQLSSALQALAGTPTCGAGATASQPGLRHPVQETPMDTSMGTMHAHLTPPRATVSPPVAQAASRKRPLDDAVVQLSDGCIQPYPGTGPQVPRSSPRQGGVAEYSQSQLQPQMKAAKLSASHTAPDVPSMQAAASAIPGSHQQGQQQSVQELVRRGAMQGGVAVAGAGAGPPPAAGAHNEPAGTRRDTSRRFFNVPRCDEGAAVAAGALWDPDVAAWYALYL